MAMAGAAQEPRRRRRQAGGQEERRASCATLGRSSSRINPQFAEFAVEGRAADAEAACDFGHAAAVMADGEADDVGLDVVEAAQMTVVEEQRDLRRTGQGR